MFGADLLPEIWDPRFTLSGTKSILGHTEDPLVSMTQSGMFSWSIVAHGKLEARLISESHVTLRKMGSGGHHDVMLAVLVFLLSSLSHAAVAHS